MASEVVPVQKRTGDLQVKLAGNHISMITLMPHLQRADRQTLISWCKTGILFFLAIYISQIPFPKGNASVKSISLSLVGLLWVVRMVLERRFCFKRTRLWRPLVVFTLITLLSAIGSIDLGYSIENIKKYTLISFFLFFAIVTNVEGLKDVKILLLALMVSTGIFSLIALTHYFITEPSFGTRLTFPYLDRNLGRFAKFYDVVIPINLSLLFAASDGSKKILYGIVLLLSLLTVFLMQNRGSYVVIFLSLLLFGIVYRRKLLLPILIVPVIAAFLVPGNMASRAKEMFNVVEYLKSDGIFNYRYDTWKGALRIISDNPVLGLGIGKSNFGKTAPKFNDLRIPYDHAHNTYLQIAVELGLVGFGAFVWLFGTTFYRGFRAYFSLSRQDERAIFIFGILCGIGGLFFHGIIATFYKQTSFFILWVSVAFLFVLIEETDQNSDLLSKPVDNALPSDDLSST